MKHLIIALLSLTLFSCEKEDNCNCIQITESNMDEARNKCSGFANSFPDFEELARIASTECPKVTTILNSKQFCNGVVGQDRVRYICQ